MNIKDIMNSDVKLVSPDTSLSEAAQIMAEKGIGFIPVGDDQLRGSLTDRDIVLRAVGKGKDVAGTHVADVMSDKVLYCRDSESLEDVARNMAEVKVRRLPVVDDNKQLVGVVSLGDLAQHLSADHIAEAFRSVTSQVKAA